MKAQLRRPHPLLFAGVIVVAVFGAAARELRAEPQVLAEKIWGPKALALDADTVYLTAIGSGEVIAVPKRGGATRVLARGQADPGEIAVDADFVYWVNHGASGGVVRVAKRNGRPEVLAASPHAYGLAADAERLYFVSGAALRAVPKHGGAVVTIVDGVDAGRPIVDDKRITWIDVGRHAVMTAPKAGGEPRPVLDFTGEVVAPLADLIIDDGFACLATDKGLVRFDLHAPASRTVLVPDFVAEMAVAGDRLFFATGASSKMSPDGVTFVSDGSLEVMPKAGGAARSLLQQLNVQDLAVDDEAVYLLDGIGKGGRLLRVPRPR